MSVYVLDTDIMTLYQRGHSLIAQQVLAHAPDELALAVISTRNVRDFQRVPGLAVEDWSK